MSDWIDDKRLLFGEDDVRSRWDRYMAPFPTPTPGQLLYERWCGSRRSDRARYWQQMNPAERSAWENLAEDMVEQSGEAFERVVRNLPEHER